jgi:hypothetical protein
MPTAGTHITIIERLALESDLAPMLGKPNAAADDPDPAALQMRYAKLGAIGPDLFYALLDYDWPLQDLANFFAKYSGAVECINDVTHQLEGFGLKVASDVTFGVSDTAKQVVDEIKEVVVNVNGVMNELMVVLVTDGYNFFTFFEAKRQSDKPRTDWYWADYLHYVRSGRFVYQLFQNAQNDPNLRAYAYGYLSHYITDVVGHPYVNQVVGAPWRLYWQRHHLVENFMDSYVWDRWHDSNPPLPPPSNEEAPLDTIRSAPNELGMGAPFTSARLNDHIHIGDPSGTDPIDTLVTDICKKIHHALEDIGIAEPMPFPPGDPAFQKWTQMMAKTFKDTYPGPWQPPENLLKPNIGGLGRSDGYPTPDDIGAAYVVLRMFLRSATEEKVKEPEFPDISEDVWNAIKKMLDNIGHDLSSITPPPHIGGGGSLSLSSLWDAIKRWVEWACDTASKLAEAALDLLKGVLDTAGALLIDMVKALLYLVKKGLFELYKAIRFFLVRTAYAIPFTDELNDTIAGQVSATSLWTVPSRPTGAYPFEEVPDPERTTFASSYAPWVSPEMMPQVQALSPNLLEMPPTWPGPYKTGAKPDDLIDAPHGQREMMAASGPNSGPFDLTLPLPLPQADVANYDFGGAIANCRSAFISVDAALRANNMPPPQDFFPDYNLDGDRGYAWPCWDVTTPPNGLDPASHAAPVVVIPQAIT